MAKAKAVNEKRSSERRHTAKRRCGLCGKTGSLTRTECCGNWICDDAANYALFSYRRNSCFHNHMRFTLCSYHYNEGHSGKWKTCEGCRRDFETEMYVYYGTNEYNFEVLEDPPEYEPTKCSQCGRVIALANGGYTVRQGEYWCGVCGP